MFKISVIMPLYNVEKYLDESINSIICQTIGFEENIQLILVNDGSKDATEKICEKYVRRFPKNIIYVLKENGGISSARNLGMKRAEGDYIVFFDGDDRWVFDAFEKMISFLEKHEEDIDLVASRSCYFDRKEGFSNPMDYMFSSDRIIDISIEFSCVQAVVNNVMFKKSTIIDLCFDERLSIHEDTVFVSQAIKKKASSGF